MLVEPEALRREVTLLVSENKSSLSSSTIPPSGEGTEIIIFKKINYQVFMNSLV